VAAFLLGDLGQFFFTKALASGASYYVTVGTQPTREVCTVTEGSGTVASANVTDVAVDCEESTGGGGSGGTLSTMWPPLSLPTAGPMPKLPRRVCSIVILLFEDLAHFFKRGEPHRTFTSREILEVVRREGLDVEFAGRLVEHTVTGIHKA